MAKNFQQKSSGTEPRQSGARPRLRVGLVIGLLVLVLCLGLAVWQWQRADQARAWLAAEQLKAASTPLPFAQALQLRDRQFQPVRVSGHFDNAHSVLLNSRTYQNRVGYYLLSPLHTDSGHWVLVNRGWLPAGEYRNQLPPIPAVTGRVTLTGTLYLPEHNIFLPSGNDIASGQWPLQVAEVNFAAIGRQLEVELAPFVIRLGPDQHPGSNETPLPKPWKTVEATISPARHIAYAVQWVAIGIAGLVIFTLAGRRRRQGSRDR